MLYPTLQLIQLWELIKSLCAVRELCLNQDYKEAATGKEGVI